MRALLVALLILLAGCEQPQSSTFQIIAFTSQTCIPCQRDKPLLQSLEAQGYSVTNIDAARRDLIEHYSVTHLPTYIVYSDGQQVLRTSDIQQVLRSLRGPMNSTETPQLEAQVLHWRLEKFDGDPPKPGEHKVPVEVIEGGEGLETVISYPQQNIQ